MQIKIHKNKLEELMTRVYSVVSEYSPIPMFSNVLLEVKEGGIYVSGTSNEISIVSKVKEIEIIEEGAVALNGKSFYNIVRELPSTEIDMKVENLLTILVCGGSTVELPGTSKEEFPSLIGIEPVNNFSIPHSLLQRAVDKTIGFTSRLEKEEILSGVLLDVRSEELRFVASDRNSLVIFKKKYPTQVEGKWLVGTKILKEVNKFKEEVKIGLEEKKIGFYGEDTEVTGRLMEGSEKYPQYESALPYGEGYPLILSKEKLIFALKRLLIFAPEINKVVKFKIEKEEVKLEASSERGEAKEKLEVNYEGPPLQIGFNGSFLLNIINKIDKEEVKFLLFGKNKAVVITPTQQEEEEELIYVLMPVEID